MLTYKLIPTSDLIPYARNSRTHSEAQVTKIASSIKEFGFINPVVTDGKNGIVAGHGRVLAANKLGLKEVPCVEASHLTEAQKRAYVIADNRMALDAGWDIDLLKVELGDLQSLDFDLALTGFDPGELENFLAEKTEGLTDPDAVPETPVNPVTVLGDVWVMGKHRLMCGDSTSIDAVDKLMAGGKADMVLTDPPYGVSFVGVKGSMYSGGKRAGKNSAEMIKADDLRGDDLSQLFLDSISCASVSSKDGAAMYIFFAINRSAETLAGLSGIGLEIRNWLIWDKGNVGFHAMGAQYKPNYEAFLYCHKAGKSPVWYGGQKEQTIWRHPVEREGLHPTMKPVSLLQRALQNNSKQGDEVLDLFGGSGSTLIACEKTARESRLMELDPKYCDVIVKRWQEFTGHKATLESTDQTFEDVASNRYDWKKDSAASYDVAIAEKRKELEAST
jgi:DNA modification methylase